MQVCMLLIYLRKQRQLDLVSEVGRCVSDFVFQLEPFYHNYGYASQSSEDVPDTPKVVEKHGLTMQSFRLLFNVVVVSSFEVCRYMQRAWSLVLVVQSRSKVDHINTIGGNLHAPMHGDEFRSQHRVNDFISMPPRGNFG